MKNTLAMRQLSEIFPVANGALYRLQISVTVYCSPCYTRADRIPSSPGDIYGAIDSKANLIISSCYEVFFCNFPSVTSCALMSGVFTHHHASNKMRLWEVLNDLLRRCSPFTIRHTYHIEFTGSGVA